jgi:signal transduction histidine kinase
MSARTLVSRMAVLQVAVLLVALGAVVGLTFVFMTLDLQREWDEGLRSAVAPALERLRRRPSRATDPEWLEDLEDRRPTGARIEVQDARGAVLSAQGAGPALMAGRDGCRGQSGWRVCQTTVAGVRILAARPRQSALEARRRALWVIAGVALLVALAASLLARTINRRALAPLSQLARRLTAIRPGEDTHAGITPPFAELAALTRSFDDLLARFAETLARERRFAAEASHELRTPLTVLRGEVELIARGAGHPDQALRSIDHLGGLVEALLWLSRAQAPLDRSVLGVVNLADLAREQAAAAALFPGRAVTVDAAEEVLVAADEALLTRAVANLVDNACKYGSSGTAVALSVSEGGGRAVLSVVDRGDDLPAELRELIFEPFFRAGRARASTRGFGLGLPLARSIARAHGGDIVLAASTAGATRFELSLPSLGEAEAPHD